jgi:hypothetical protein
VRKGGLNHLENNTILTWLETVINCILTVSYAIDMQHNKSFIGDLGFEMVICRIGVELMTFIVHISVGVLFKFNYLTICFLKT